MITDSEFKKIKQGDAVLVYDSNEKKEKQGVVESLGGYCALVKTEEEKSIFYKEEIIEIKK